METAARVDALNAVAGELNRREPEQHLPGKDAEGYDCPVSLVGRVYLHGTRGTLYKVAGWAWDGERDLWMVIYHNVNANLSAIPYARKVSNFSGRNKEDAWRFVEVHDVTSISPPPVELPTYLTSLGDQGDPLSAERLVRSGVL